MKLLYAEDEAAMSEAVVDMELYLGESKWSRNIKEQTRRLSGLMLDLLTLARMDEGAAPAQKAALSLSGLAEQALEPFLQPMEAQGIALERDIQPEVSLTADPAQLEQLLSLLLDNAVKYTGPGGRIRFSVKQEGKRARLGAVLQRDPHALGGSYQVRMKDENTDFINILSEMNGVQSAVLVSYNGDYMG